MNLESCCWTLELVNLGVFALLCWAIVFKDFYILHSILLLANSAAVAHCLVFLLVDACTELVSHCTYLSYYQLMNYSGHAKSRRCDIVRKNLRSAKPDPDTPGSPVSLSEISSFLITGENSTELQKWRSSLLWQATVCTVDFRDAEEELAAPESKHYVQKPVQKKSTSFAVPKAVWTAEYYCRGFIGLTVCWHHDNDQPHPSWIHFCGYLLQVPDKTRRDGS